MTRRLRSVLLIDDDPADIYLHQRVLKKLDCAEHIDVCETAMDALRFLQAGAGRPAPRPDLIFLDINLPGLNGWEFLQAWRELPGTLRENVVIAMLTSSQSAADAEAAAESPEVAEFLHKPLTREHVEALLARHFPGRGGE